MLLIIFDKLLLAGQSGYIPNPYRYRMNLKSGNKRFGFIVLSFYPSCDFSVDRCVIETERDECN